MARRSLHLNAVDERARHFLKVLIERYIRDGEPVGSRTLAREAGLNLSAATIRNVLSDLEEAGYISSPHTSAGRIPTAHGYRIFVDSLLTLQPVPAQEVERLKERLEVNSGSARLMETASQLLSGLTHMAAVVMMPRRDQVSFRQIEFLPLDPNRILAILVTNEGEVLNRVVETKRRYTASELEQSANFLNHSFAGQHLASVREALVRDLRETREDMDRLLSQAMEMAELVLNERKEPDDCVIAGQSNLLDFDELANMERLRRLFNAFNQKQEILHLLDACMRADGMQIFIGEESGYQQFNGCSLITAPYEINDQVVGVLGVIGPTRMAYDRVIPIVDMTAKLLGSALAGR